VSGGQRQDRQRRRGSDRRRAPAHPRSPAAPPEGVKKKPPAPVLENDATLPQPLTPENLPEIWAHVLRKLPGLLAGMLKKGEMPAIIAPNNLALRFPIDYNGAKELVEAALLELTGQPWIVRVEGGANAVSPSDLAPAEGSLRSRNAREEAEKLPLVRRAIDILGASLQRVDEGFGILPRAGANADEILMEDTS